MARGRGEQPFLWLRRDGIYRPWSWRRVAEEVRFLARCLRAQGLARGDRVLLVSENRPEWLIADLAIMAAGGITVPAYTTNTTREHAFLLAHSGAAAAVVSNDRLAKQLLPAVGTTPGVRLVISIEPLAEGGSLGARLLSWQEALALGEQQPDPAGNGAAALGRDDTACFIYTSGTGGLPKGVMLSHGNVLSNVAGASAALALLGLDEHEVFLSFLPLSHAYEHTAGQFLPIAVGAQIYYADGLDTLSTNLVEARPTIMTCVPRLYEVMRQRILNTVARQRGIKPKLFAKTVELGSRAYREPAALSLGERLLDRVLDRTVRAQARARFGGRIKALVSGGAPLNHEVGLFFTALGLPVFQGYGQTECAPVVSVNTPRRVKLHSVGPPIPGIEVKIADDGEILVRGASVMQGYWRDEEATAQALKDGWLHTGDIGLLDDDGFLQITDRKKDIIVNSGGDNLAPQRVEGVLLLQPEIGQAIVYGDRRPHLVALLVPDADFARGWARARRLPPDLAALASNPEFQGALGEAVRRANQSLSVLERVRHFRLLAEPFSIENGMMTPTLKLRRQVIYRTHCELFESLYDARH
ncbi:MAG TPA: AMP-dependent synthetase/ligase [Geminicoccaceae bacterium]|nr:AMP-dependent synthetase/ligase [Geminicoccaceae bacterium]